MKEIHIQCEVQDNKPASAEKSDFRIFLFQAIPIEINWNPPEKSHVFSLIFTSKIAVTYFHSWLSNHKIENEVFKNLKSIACVGQYTAEYAQSILSPLLPFKDTSFFYPKQRGLESLFVEEKIFFESERIFIFTSSDGKTKETVENLNSRNIKKLQLDVIPIYKLEPLAVEFDPIFSILDSRFIFHCRSAQILKQLVQNLVIYFKVKSPKELPNFIYFHTWEKSSSCELKKLNLIDRKIC